jgi:hypothetical protein
MVSAHQLSGFQDGGLAVNDDHLAVADFSDLHQ